MRTRIHSSFQRIKIIIILLGNSDASGGIRTPWAWPYPLLDLSKSVKSDLLDYLVQNIPLMVLLLLVFWVDNIWGTPADVSNSVRIWTYKAAWMVTNVMIATVTSGLAAANESVVIKKC